MTFFCDISFPSTSQIYMYISSRILIAYDMSIKWKMWTKLLLTLKRMKFELIKLFVLFTISDSELVDQASKKVWTFWERKVFKTESYILLRRWLHDQLIVSVLNADFILSILIINPDSYAWKKIRSYFTVSISAPINVRYIKFFGQNWESNSSLSVSRKLIPLTLVP